MVLGNKVDVEGGNARVVSSVQCPSSLCLRYNPSPVAFSLTHAIQYCMQVTGSCLACELLLLDCCCCIAFSFLLHALLCIRTGVKEEG